MSFWISKKVRARKPHTCCEGKGLIEPGQTYYSHAGMHEGEFQNYNICATCEAFSQAVEKLFPDVIDDGRCLGELRWTVLDDLLTSAQAAKLRALWPCAGPPRQ